jgi:ribosome-associated translation inhibitor RaiA
MDIHIQAHNHLLSLEERQKIETKLLKLAKFSTKHLSVELNIAPMDGKVDDNCVEVGLKVTKDGKEFFRKENGTEVVKVAEKCISLVFGDISKWKDKTVTAKRRV